MSSQPVAMICGFAGHVAISNISYYKSILWGSWKLSGQTYPTMTDDRLI